MEKNSAYGPVSAVTGATDYDSVALSSLIKRLLLVRDSISEELQKLQEDGGCQDYETLQTEMGLVQLLQLSN